MSKAYKQAITNITGLTDTEAMQVCIEIAKSNPSVFNSACATVEVGASAMNVGAKSLLNAGKKIDAIKLVRNMTGLGLREAKEYVESL